MENKTYKKLNEVNDDDLIDYRLVKIGQYQYLRKRKNELTDKFIKLKIKKLLKEEKNVFKLKNIYNLIRKSIEDKNEKTELNIVENELNTIEDISNNINKKLDIEQEKINKLNKEVENLNTKNEILKTKIRILNKTYYIDKNIEN